AFGTTNLPYCTSFLNNTSHVHTFWLGFSSQGYTSANTQELLTRRRFYVPPGTTNLAMGFTMDNDCKIFINETLITTNNVAHFTFDTNSSFDINTNSGVYQYFTHANCATPDSLVLDGITNTAWHVGWYLLAVRTYDDGFE